jgi:hypothetical protein
MMAVSLIAGIGLLLAGLLAIGFGIPVKEFSFGNTLILVGAIAACTGIIMLGVWTVVRELRNIADRLGPGMPGEQRPGTTLQSASAALGDQAPEDGGFLFSRDQPAAEAAGNAAPWQDEAASRERGRRATGARGDNAGRKTATEPVVFLVIAEGTRAGAGANGRTVFDRSSIRSACRDAAACRIGRAAARHL